MARTSQTRPFPVPNMESHILNSTQNESNASLHAYHYYTGGKGAQPGQRRQRGLEKPYLCSFKKKERTLQLCRVLDEQ